MDRHQLIEYLPKGYAARVLDRFTAAERKNIGIHTCPGGDCDSVHSSEVDYSELLPSMFQMNAGYFLIQLASETDKEKVYKEIGNTIRPDANGVKQVIFSYNPYEDQGAT